MTADVYERKLQSGNDNTQRLLSFVWAKIEHHFIHSWATHKTPDFVIQMQVLISICVFSFEEQNFV